MALQLYEHQGAAPATGLASPINSSAASFTVNSGAGYPTGAGGALFVVCIDAGTVTEEKILCSARSTNVFTVYSGGRGYDGTTAAAHSTGSMNVTHVWSAAEASDTSGHIYTTSRDDHTQYARTDGTRNITGTQNYVNTVNSGTATFGGTVTASADATVATNFEVGEVSTLTGAVTMLSSATVAGALAVTGTLSGVAPACRVYRTTALTDVNTVFTLCPLDAIDFDNMSGFSVSTHLYTVPTAGIYAVSGAWGLGSGALGGFMQVVIQHNGSAVSYGVLTGYDGSSGRLNADHSDLVSCAASDTLGLQYFDGGGHAITTGKTMCFMSIVKVSN